MNKITIELTKFDIERIIFCINATMNTPYCGYRDFNQLFELKLRLREELQKCTQYD